MDVILHVGAHRTATTALAKYFERNKDEAAEQSIAFWGADRTRNGLFSGLLATQNSLMPDTQRQRDRAVQRIRMELDRLEKSGVQKLVVSDPIMMGSMMQNLRREKLYPDFQPRLERFYEAFGAHCRQIAFSMRSYEGYWTSALTYAIPRGLSSPQESDIDRLVTQPRRWKTLIKEALSVFPQAEIVVWPFEALAAYPDRQLALMTGAVLEHAPKHVPDMRKATSAKAIATCLSERLQETTEMTPWPPFRPDHSEGLRAQYHEDLEWLKACEDNRITYCETAGKHQHFNILTDSQDVAGNFPAHQRGHQNDREERRMV